MSTENHSQSVYDNLDAELPSVAAMAAAEVDSLIRKSYSDLEYLTKLTSILNQTIHRSETQADANVTTYFLDPVTTSVLTKSFANSYNPSLHTFEELIHASDNLTSNIKRMNPDNPIDEQDTKFLESLKKFCVSLSVYALASNQSEEDSLGTPEFQK